MTTLLYQHDIKTIPLEWIGFANQTGYGQSLISNLLSLHRCNKFDIKLKTLHGKPSENSISKTEYDIIYGMYDKKDLKNSIQVYQTIPDMHKRFKYLQRKISFVTFETFDPPDHWIPILNRFDAVFCPSAFNVDIFKKAGVIRPIFNIPHVLNTDIWNDSVKPMNYKDDIFTFLFMGTWRRRKGYDVLLQAWMEEFSPSDNVRLIIKTDKIEQSQNYISSLKKSLGKKEIAPILLERRVFDEYNLAKFMKMADCYISPTLGEGFGLPGLQSMLLKIPIIITDFSGCQEYAKEEYCTLLKPSGYLVHNSIDPIPQFTNKKWPRIRVDSVRNSMRDIIGKYDLAKQKSDKAYCFARDNFNYSVFSNKFNNMIQSVYNF